MKRFFLPIPSGWRNPKRLPNPTAAELAELCQAFNVENKNPDALLWLVVTALAIWGEPQDQDGRPMTPSEAANQIQQHADDAGLSPQDWAKAFNSFNPQSIENPSMKFDPNSLSPSPDFVDHITHTQRDALRLATFWARWGATEAVKALQLPSACLLRQESPLQLKGYLERLGQGVAINMVPISAGNFLMGSPESERVRCGDEGPQHEVKLGAFWMAQTPITQAQWREVAGWPKAERDLEPDPSHFKGDNRPVERVSWHDAQEFCRRLSESTGRNYTLPSEAQWEYACRAGTTTSFHFGGTLTPEQANCSNSETTDVAQFPANAWGLHDMHGNVWEWCQDQWHNNYEGAPNDGGAWEDHSLGEPTGCYAAGRGSATPGTAARSSATSTPRTTATTTSVSASVASLDAYRLLRGGSWDAHPADCRSAYRNIDPPVDRDYNIGFRVCCLPQD